MTQIVNLNNSFDSYQKLIDLYEEHKNKSFETVTVELRQWFALNMCAPLGGVLDTFSEKLNEVKLEYINPVIDKMLIENDFLTYYGRPRQFNNSVTNVKYLKLKLNDTKFFNNYVMNDFIRRIETPMMSDLVKEKLSEAIFEIFINAQTHSQSENIYSCGLFVPQENRIEFTIVDTGIGFKKKINERFNVDLSSLQSIKWATMEKNTTKIGMSGGTGLALLKEFINKNRGNLQIISGDGYYQYNNQGETTQIFRGSYPGTIVNLHYKTDDRSSLIIRKDIENNNIF